jgi:ubiquinone/menaquinone biosynthesis C-methylase UbiE
MRFLRQYNPFAAHYNQQIETMNEKSIAEFQAAVKGIKTDGNKVIDLGCGAADLAPFLRRLGYEYCGVDSSEEMVALARKATGADVRVEDFTNTSFESGSFDLLVSKWAIQSTNDIEAVYKESQRLLKDKGWLIFLVAHPIRQFLEKKRSGKNYFTQEIVDSIIFNGTITVKEPSHTLSEYFSSYFLENFSLQSVLESYEFPGAEQINNDIYPTHLLIVSQKK